MIDRGRDFVQWLLKLVQYTAMEWRRCPHCGSTWTIKNGSYARRPWTFTGRQVVRVQRHLCHACHKSYSEEKAWLVRGSWYGREVHRYAVDHCAHARSSLRRTAEEVRSWIGQQERWWLWHVWERAGTLRERCYLAASTVHRWAGKAGKKAKERLPEQWAGVENSGQFGVDGLWAKLRGKVTRVVLAMTDTATGMVWGMCVAEGEERAEHWAGLFQRVKEAGLSWRDLNGLVSDGSQGLYSFMRDVLSQVHQQRCVWHFWRSLAGDMAKVLGAVVEEKREAVGKELKGLLHAVIDARSYEAAEVALQRLLVYPGAELLAQKINVHLDRLLFHLLPGHEGLSRVSPEWLWRDFRLRLSHGRNHGSESRLEEAALLWMVYHNFTPAQWRSERKRHYKHPGQSPLQVAGASPGEISYLDALEV
jgi:transposase-like protein